jgi:hypothetical protein
MEFFNHTQKQYIQDVVTLPMRDFLQKHLKLTKTQRGCPKLKLRIQLAIADALATEEARQEQQNR